MSKIVFDSDVQPNSLSSLMEGYLSGLAEVCHTLFGARGEAVMYEAVGDAFKKYLKKYRGIEFSKSEPWDRYCEIVEYFTAQGFYSHVELEAVGADRYWMLESGQYAGNIWEEQKSWEQGTPPCPLWAVIVSSLAEIEFRIVLDEVHFRTDLHGYESVFHFERFRPSSENILARALREIRESIFATNMLDVLAENTSDAIFLKDLEGRYLFVNKAFAAIMHKPIDAILGSDDTAHYPADTAKALKDNDRETLRSGGIVTCEVSIAIDNVARTYSTTKGVYRNAEGKPAGLFGISRDITEIKRLQELECRAQRLESAGQIAGQVAHDLNNLLAPISAYPELIRELLSPTHPALELLKTIEDSGTRIADINQQLLTLSRRGHYSQAVLNLNTIITRVITDLGQLPDGIHCECDLRADLMNVCGGDAQLYRVILNIINNSLDAVRNRGKIVIKTENIYVDEITIEYSRVPSGEYAMVTISDTGIGIPKDIVQKIFDPFFTTKPSDKKRGSGLGLSVVDAVMKDHGGYINLKTEIGKGTSFFLYFPISRENVINLHNQVDTPSGGESILVVDDDCVQREVVSKLLSTLGYRVTCCENGESAVELLRGTPQDLLILDMIMPGGMDGVETFCLARKVNPRQRAILVSGYSDSEKVQEALSMGAGAFIKKPLSRSIIGRAVRNELDRSAKLDRELVS